MSIITLTTDLGYRDPYLAIVKAKLLSASTIPQIIDLSCNIKDNTISDAAYILKNSLPHFPEDSIHLVAIKFISDSSNLNKNTGIDNSRYLVTRYLNQFIVTPDTGLFTLLDSTFNEKVYQVYYDGEMKHHFFLKDVFVDVALHLLETNSPAEIATETSDYYKAFQFESYVDGNILRGKGIYVDDFGNIVTNITKLKFEEIVGKRNFTISLPGKRVNQISTTYDDVRFGSILAIFNSFGNLEVAVNGQSAYNLIFPRDIGNNFDFNILIEFYD